MWLDPLIQSYWQTHWARGQPWPTPTGPPAKCSTAPESVNRQHLPLALRADSRRSRLRDRLGRLPWIRVRGLYLRQALRPATDSSAWRPRLPHPQPFIYPLTTNPLTPFPREDRPFSRGDLPFPREDRPFSRGNLQSREKGVRRPLSPAGQRKLSADEPKNGEREQARGYGFFGLSTLRMTDV